MRTRQCALELSSRLPGAHARLAWRSADSGRWRVALEVKNLLDLYYLERRDDLLNQIGTRPAPAWRRLHGPAHTYHAQAQF
jgi:hypothetical protein